MTFWQKLSDLFHLKIIHVQVKTQLNKKQKTKRNMSKSSEKQPKCSSNCVAFTWWNAISQFFSRFRCMGFKQQLLVLAYNSRCCCKETPSVTGWNLDNFNLHYTGNRQTYFFVSNTCISNKRILCETHASIASMQVNDVQTGTGFDLRPVSVDGTYCILETTVLIF